MWFLAAGRDIYDKINALNGGNANGAIFFVIVSWGLVAVLILLIAFLVSRKFFHGRGRPARRLERRGEGSRKPNQEPADATHDGADNRRFEEDFSLDDTSRRLDELLPETRVSLFWDVSEMRCGCLGYVVASSGKNIEIKFDSDSAPRKGRAILASPEDEGHVSFYEVKIDEGANGTNRILAPATTRPASRMNRRYRSHVAVQAALTTRDRAQNETDPVVARLHNMAFDGLGVLSEGRIRPHEVFILRVKLPGYLEVLTLEGEVAWSERDLAGIWRAGLNLDFDDLETRLNLADYMLGRLKAESSALILEKRRGEHTSGRIPQINLTS
ncbi:MAG: hypothetical protein ACI97A_000805 [Planctomycetota bacterium]|jgi:hypothetical protein